MTEKEPVDVGILRDDGRGTVGQCVGIGPATSAGGACTITMRKLWSSWGIKPVERAGRPIP